LTLSSDDEEIKKKGFDLFCKKDAVRRLTPDVTARAVGTRKLYLY
jgi:hypothetical protein